MKYVEMQELLDLRAVMMGIPIIFKDALAIVQDLFQDGHVLEAL